MKQDEDLGVLRRIRTGQQRQPTDQTTSDQIPETQPPGALTPAPLSHSGILSHTQQVSGLTGLRRNLLQGIVDYALPSDDGSPMHPDQVMAMVAANATQARGVLLVGSAGVGKTRLCLEVSRRAVDQGWTVLHVTVGEPAVTTPDLFEAVVSTRSERVLVVLDYLNECQRVDVSAIRQRYLPQMSAAGITVAMLAACRPG